MVDLVLTVSKRQNAEISRRPLVEVLINPYRVVWEVLHAKDGAETIMAHEPGRISRLSPVTDSSRS
jgi:hypothetical protein